MCTLSHLHGNSSELSLCHCKKRMFSKLDELRAALCYATCHLLFAGYTGNYAGHVGATLAFMAGLFDSPEASNYKGGNVWDVIPADVVVADILAAAAAVGAGVAGRCVVTKTDNGRLSNNTESSSKSVIRNTGTHNKPVRNSGNNTINLQAFAHTVEHHVQQQQQQQQDDRQLLIIHSGSSTLYPLTIMESWNYGLEGCGAWETGWRLCRGCAAPLTPDHEPDLKKSAALVAWTGWKVWAASYLLRWDDEAVLLATLNSRQPCGSTLCTATHHVTQCSVHCADVNDRWLGEEKAAKKLTVGYESFKIINQPKTDVNLRFSTSNMQKLASKLEPSEREDFLLLWRPVTNSSSPTAAGAVCSAVVPGAAPRFSFQATAAPADCKAAAMAGLEDGLNDLALDHDIQRVDQGSVIKVAKLTCAGSCSASSSSRGSSCCADSDGPASGSSSDVEDTTSNDSSSDKSQPGGEKQRPGAVLGPEQLAELAHMKSVPIRWMDFHLNLGAFLYVGLFRKPVPPKVSPITNQQVIDWLKIKPEDAWVRHQFKHYK